MPGKPRRGNPNKPLRKIVTEARKLNALFNRSSSNMEMLLDIVFDGRGCNRPEKEVATRWNSTLRLLLRWFSSAPHQEAFHAERIKALAAAAQRKAKNPVTQELWRVIGQAASIGLLVLECTLKNEGSDALLLTGVCDVLLLFSKLKQEKWVVPEDPHLHLAHGKADIDKYKSENPKAITVEMDGVLYQGEEVNFEDLEEESQILIEVLSDQIKERYLNTDPAQHKNILRNPAFLKQVVLAPNGFALLKKLFSMAEMPESQATAAFEEGKKLVTELCDRFRGNSRLESDAIIAPPALEPNKDGAGPSNHLDYNFFDEVDQSEPDVDGGLPAQPRSAAQAAKDELDAFLSAKHCKVPVNKVFDWWYLDSVKTTYPHLRRVALAVFSTFPSSAASEREFSTAGKDATAARSQLSSVNLRVLSYLALNSKRLREVTRDDNSVKLIPELSKKQRLELILGIERMTEDKGEESYE